MASLVKGTGEDPLCFAICDMLNLALPENVLWTHHPNNFMPINHKAPAEVRRLRIHSARMDRMGLRKGWPDYDFIHPATHIMHMIEVKTAIGQLSKEQRTIRNQCQSNGHPWALCRSVEQVWQQLHDWGFPIRRIAF
jgi:hypothetical protein